MAPSVARVLLKVKSLVEQQDVLGPHTLDLGFIAILLQTGSINKPIFNLSEIIVYLASFHHSTMDLIYD